MERTIIISEQVTALQAQRDSLSLDPTLRILAAHKLLALGDCSARTLEVAYGLEPAEKR